MQLPFRWTILSLPIHSYKLSSILLAKSFPFAEALHLAARTPLQLGPHLNYHNHSFSRALATPILLPVNVVTSQGSFFGSFLSLAANNYIYRFREVKHHSDEFQVFIYRYNLPSSQDSYKLPPQYFFLYI